MRMIEDEHDDGRQLWCAVIQQALFDATQPLAKLRHVRMEQLRAREWLTVPNNDFAEVCAMAGIDADRVRAVATVRVEEARKNDPDDRGVGHSNPKRRRDRSISPTQETTKLEIFQ